MDSLGSGLRVLAHGPQGFHGFRQSELLARHARNEVPASNFSAQLQPFPRDEAVQTQVVQRIRCAVPMSCVVNPSCRYALNGLRVYSGGEGR